MSLPGGGPVGAVFDVNALVGAAAGGNSPFRSWPSPPPLSGNSCADSLGVIVDAAEFALWLSPHLLDNTRRELVDVLKWDDEHADLYAGVLADAADHSGGGIVDPPATVGDCPDWEDNLVLDLVAEVGAFLLVSEDADLTSMSPWRGRPIIRARQFAENIAASRRHRRSNG